MPRFLVFGVILFVTVSELSATERASFVGAERCRLCHRDVHESWLATPHASASASVWGAASSADDQDRCLTCHATAGRERLGVQCEACHGPGSEYAQPEIMIDPEKAALAGLARISIAVCERCHENDEPGHRGKLVMPRRSEWKLTIHEVKSRE
jgi:Cytochrome c554 and c-prime